MSANALCDRRPEKQAFALIALDANVVDAVRPGSQEPATPFSHSLEKSDLRLLLAEDIPKSGGRKPPVPIA